MNNSTCNFIGIRRVKSFFRLKQFGKIVTEYEIELRELAKFVPEFANFEKYMYFKFEERLTLEIREKILISGN